jgi:uncharacterized protein YjiS (DUF1127 family)
MQELSMRSQPNVFPELSADSALAASIGLSLAALGRKLAGIARSFHEVRARAEAMHELAVMSDAELADIGLSRAAIPHLWDQPRKRG